MANYKKNWYEDSKCFVSFCGVNSNLFKKFQGFSQGRILSAFMFLVYINDLLSELCQEGIHDLVLGNLHIPSILLANDTVLMNNSPKSSQCLPNHVEKYVFTWRLHYNPSKVIFIVFNKTKKCSVSHRVKLFESDISKPDSTIYAGCILQSNIKCDKLTERVCKTTRSKIHYLYSIGVNDSESIQLCLQKYGNAWCFSPTSTSVKYGPTDNLRHPNARVYSNIFLPE